MVLEEVKNKLKNAKIPCPYFPSYLLKSQKSYKRYTPKKKIKLNKKEKIANP